MSDFPHTFTDVVEHVVGLLQAALVAGSADFTMTAKLDTFGGLLIEVATPNGIRYFAMTATRRDLALDALLRQRGVQVAGLSAAGRKQVLADLKRQLAPPDEDAL